MSELTKLISDQELEQYLQDGWELVNTVGNPHPQPYFYALVRCHQHHFTIPVQWNYESHMNGDGLAYRWATMLRCECGQEEARQ